MEDRNARILLLRFNSYNPHLGTSGSLRATEDIYNNRFPLKSLKMVGSSRVFLVGIDAELYGSFG
jgi:hypothetical protein